jgi:hypothetical protein
MSGSNSNAWEGPSLLLPSAVVSYPKKSKAGPLAKMFLERKEGDVRRLSTAGAKYGESVERGSPELACAAGEGRPRTCQPWCTFFVSFFVHPKKEKKEILSIFKRIN